MGCMGHGGGRWEKRLGSLLVSARGGCARSLPGFAGVGC